MYNSSSLKKKQPKKEIIKSKWIKPFWILYVCGLLVLVLIFTLISFGWVGFMPSFSELENPQTNLATEVYSSDGELIGKYYLENRSPCKYDELSIHLINTLKATEDIRFEKHSGIDIRALGRVLSGVLTRSKKGGGSTITQQLAKNLFPTRTNEGKLKTVVNKFNEWVVAVKLEREYSKNEILAMYLNTVDFGNNSMGIKSAAATYFNKTPADLNTEESALLIGLLKAPTKFSPKRNPVASLQRRNTVIEQLYKYKYISKNDRDSIQQIPIDLSQFAVQHHATGVATYFREYLRLWLADWCRNNPKKDGSHYDIYKDGLKIYTTIDSRMQKHAERAV